MRLNKLTSAVSVGLLTVTLTACGSSDDDKPVYQFTPATDTGHTTTTPTNPTKGDKQDDAKTAAIKQAAQAQGLKGANLDKFVEANKNADANSAEFKALLDAAVKQQNAQASSANDTTKPVSDVVEKTNPFIGKVDTTKELTVSTNQYTRQLGSTYNKSANPDELGGLGAVATSDPTNDNPYLTNYVLGSESYVDSNGVNRRVAIDSTGEAVTATVSDDGSVLVDKKTKDDSPYVLRNGLKYATQSDKNRKYDYSAVIQRISNTISDPNFNPIPTIQETNADNVNVDTSLADYALELAKNKEVAPNTTASVVNYLTDKSNNQLFSTIDPNDVNDVRSALHRSGLVVYNNASDLVGNKIGKKLGLKVPSLGLEENIYQIDPDTGKLVAVNGITGSDSTETLDFMPADVGTSKNISVANNLPTRVFGKNYQGYEAGATGSQTTNNSYTARFDNKDNLSKIKATKLNQVQYGRLTNNIDALTEDETLKRAKDDTSVIYREFQDHGAPNSVDTYFYRGTNRTNFDQMNAVKAKGGTIEYFGHALTYNIGPKVTQVSADDSLPTSYDLGTSESTIGNFVQAKFDTATSKLDGSIYNFINNDATNKPNNFKKQDLVTFTGDVFGNTATGVSTKLGAKTETGSFNASFFGSNANEIGGSVSSIDRAEGYGKPKWGAVFGATRGTTVGNFNTIEKK